jgi:hypothetical protein
LNENEGLLNNIKVRLFEALELLADNVEMIELTADTLRESLNTVFIEKTRQTI